MTYFKIVKLGSQTSGPHLGFFLENWAQISKFFKVSFNERLKNTSIANICPGLCPVLFVEVFTRKGPELCKFLDRVCWARAFGQRPCLRHNAMGGTTTIYNHQGLLTEHTVEISQIFSDKNHPGLKTRQRSTCS